jgi:hypothetical protein
MGGQQGFDAAAELDVALTKTLEDGGPLPLVGNFDRNQKGCLGTFGINRHRWTPDE